MINPRNFLAIGLGEAPLLLLLLQAVSEPAVSEPSGRQLPDRPTIIVLVI